MRSDYYLQPFERNLWLALSFSIIAINIFIVIITQYFVNEEKNNRTLIDDLLIGLESLCNQSGSRFQYENIPFRILWVVLRMISYMALASFGAVITSFLTTEIPQIPFQNIEEFVQNGEYELVVRTGWFGEVEFFNVIP